MAEPLPGAPPSAEASEKRLDSWKEIAAYLNRDVITVQRWERREGMPVHLHVHHKRGSVYALTFEVDRWVRSRRGILKEDREPLNGKPSDASDDPQRSWNPVARLWLALVGVAVLGLLAAAYIL